MENLNLNIDAQTLEQCLKSISNFGGTTYQNICTGVSTYVVWGSLDWVGVCFLIGLGIALSGLLLFGLVTLILDR